MVNISGISSLSGAYGLSGYGGLVSGLDRDSLINSMTIATRTKIAGQMQKKQTVSWRQEAMRSITDKMISFTNKYMTYTSSTNLLANSLFSRSQITATGANSKYVTASGSSNTADSLSILGIKSMAKNAQASSAQSVSSQTLNTGEIAAAFDTVLDVDVVTGDSMTIKYGGQRYVVKMQQGDEYSYNTAAEAAESINKILETIEVGADKKLSDVLEVRESGGALSFVNVDPGGNALELAGHTGDLLKDLGFLGEDETFSGLEDDRKKITSDGLKAEHQAVLMETRTLAEQLSGRKISFTYNGTSKTITLGEYDENSTLADLQADLQKGLDSAFGKGRVSVGKEDTGGGGRLSFTTTLPGGGADTTSVLTVGSADAGLLGSSGLLGISAGAANRLNLNSSLETAGLTRDGSSVAVDKSQPLTISNGGRETDLSEYGLTWESSINEIMKVINNLDDLDLQISYQSNTDKFMIRSSEQGAAGQISLGGTLSEVLFGAAGSDYTVQERTDAVVLVRYGGSDDEVEIVRGSNTFSVDGMTIQVNGTFGYDSSGMAIAGTEAIEFNAQVDVDKTTEIVAQMVADYNAMLDSILTELGTRPDRSYQPLTDEQKEGMTESQIAQWEAEARKGLLFNDSDLRSLSSSLRFVIPTGLQDTLSKMGISTSTNYSDNGKLVFDEQKFREALSSDPEAVAKAFTQTTSEKDGTSAGLMQSMKGVIDRYAATTGSVKGVLIERAGSVSSPVTVLSNAYQKQIDQINSMLEKLNSKLKKEQDYYVRQFTSLETLISNMNSQSSYLSQMFDQW